MKYIYLKCFSFIALFTCCALIHASGIEIPKESPPRHSFNEKEWKEVVKDMDYSKEAPPVESKPSKGFSFSLDPGIGKVIIFTIVFALLVFILVRVLKGNMLLGDKKIRSEDSFTEIQTHEDIHKSNLEKLYSEALGNKDFRLAVRYCYLIVIRELSLRQLINWKKEKTNQEYIFEMMNNAFDKPFREITWLFERIWYGETELSEQNFMVVNPRFHSLISEVKNDSKETTQPQNIETTT